ncbi:MAG: hypothetical protein LBG52_08860 [Candidatus Peribacteria bacterium]|nr:hypothetical protein [Candidatus Peribacteria bacterium]
MKKQIDSNQDSNIEGEELLKFLEKEENMEILGTVLNNSLLPSSLSQEIKAVLEPLVNTIKNNKSPVNLTLQERNVLILEHFFRTHIVNKNLTNDQLLKKSPIPSPIIRKIKRNKDEVR